MNKAPAIKLAHEFVREKVLFIMSHATRPVGNRLARIQQLHELLFSLNTSFLVLPVLSERMKNPLILRGRDIYNFVYDHVPIPFSSSLRTVEPYRLDFAVLALAGALIIFSLLRIISRFAFTGMLLNTLGGAVAVSGLPLTAYLLGLPISIFALEAVAAGIGALLFSFGHFRPSLWSLALLLTAHFALWTWIVWQLLWFWWLYPTLGFCSALVWILYVPEAKGSHLGAKVAI